jgi:hypothetical protein
MNSSCSFVFFICIPVVFSNAMASEGVEKYSLAIQFIFSSFDNFENPATVYSFSVVICNYLQRHF